MEISSLSHRPYKENGSYVINKNEILLQILADGTLIFVPITEDLKLIFGFHLMENITNSALNEESNKWSRNDILALIGLYQKYEKNFKSTSERNDKVWQHVSIEMKTLGHNFSQAQCSNKWKYLKSKYIKKKDNMKTSGAKCINFEYFDNFDEIFGHQANVSPLAINGSLRGGLQINANDFTNDLENFEERDSEPPKKKTRSSRKNLLINVLQEQFMKREENKERRHKEILEAFNAKMDALLSKF